MENYLIGRNITRAIKEHKWLAINYLNSHNELTKYWIGIKDINPNNKTLTVDIFNEYRGGNLNKNYLICIKYSGIKEAVVLDLTINSNDYGLIEKIEKNPEAYRWLNYDSFNHNILNYYLDCDYYNKDPSLNSQVLIEGIDLDSFKEKNQISLNQEQEKEIINFIKSYDLHPKSGTFFLVINELSLSLPSNKFYVVFYHTIKYNPKTNKLILNKELEINKSFLIEERSNSLQDYVDMNLDEFFELYKQDKEKAISYINLKRELIDTRPNIFSLKVDSIKNLAAYYHYIEKLYLNEQLTNPLKAFFGILNKRNYVRKKEPSIILYDNKIDPYQLRVIYNALKYPTTYVQGPPGSGKTQTISNVILSCFYENRTCLVCSNNNAAVDGVFNKINLYYYNEKIKFPFLRLGNKSELRKALDYINELSKLEIDESKINLETLSSIKKENEYDNEKLANLLSNDDKRIETLSYIEQSERLYQRLNNETSKVARTLKTKIEELEKVAHTFKEITSEDVLNFFKPLKNNDRLLRYINDICNLKILKLKTPKYKKIIEICTIIDKEEGVKKFAEFLREDNNLKLLLDVFPIIFCTNQSIYRLGTPAFKFDLAIMDEAGQCDPATSLIPISKCDNLLLVGDPNQLKPIVTFSKETNDELLNKYNIENKEIYNYFENSIIEVMKNADNITKYIMLRCHYRCGKKIIDYSNKRYYQNKLEVLNNTEGSLGFINVNNVNGEKNKAIDEALAVLNYIKDNQIKDCCVLTPFVEQSKLLKELFKKNNIDDVTAGTIHSLQGSEKNTIIFSPAITQYTKRRTYDWVKNNSEIINVGVTRAKNRFIICGDKEQILKRSSYSKNDDLSTLVQYVLNKGNIKIDQSNNTKVEIGYSNYSVYEDEFYKTLVHFCSCYKNFEAKRNVRVKKLIEDMKVDLTINKDYEFDLVLFDKKIFKSVPILAFEVNGSEHIGNINRIESDKIKSLIAKKLNIQLVFIPNSFVKRYEYLSKLIVLASKKKDHLETSLFDFSF